MKKFICMVMVFVLCINSTYAMEGIKARSAILMAENGEVLWENNADEKLEPASVTKIMTLILVSEAIENRQISMDDVVTVSGYAASMGGSQIWLEEGERMTVRDLLKALIIVSANDAAVALAEYTAGAEESFVKKMNEKAAQLGMKNTTFVNCNGLEAEGHLTTARDIAIMSREALKHDIIFEFTKVWMDHIRNGESVLVNTNKLIRQYAGMTGLKTGYTSTAGYCLSATAERDGLSLIAVTMKNATTDERSADITSMLNYGFANYRCLDVMDETDIPEVNVALGKQKLVPVELEGSSKIIVNKDSNELEYIIEIDDEIRAPVMKGQEIGKIEIINGENNIKSLKIIASETVEKLSLKEIYVELMRIVLSR